ncbi:MAG: sulfatase [Opitutae bacterium]|nr:sulfatase [Opitutae bacterium]
MGFCTSVSAEERLPNFVVIFCDDLGYADLGCFGSKKIKTPNLDRMASEGMRLTSFYSTCSVCSPSRSSLLTGCYPRRVNMHVNDRNLCVLFPADKKGLNPEETTIAETLKAKDYATICVGKWHVGDHPNFLPHNQGFDSYFGIPYSNDMNRKEVPLPLLRNERVIESPVDQPMLTPRYTKEVVQFIYRNKDKPFFIYLPHTFPHVPLFASSRFKGKSAQGRYGDTIEEIDWSTGEILKALKDAGVDENTLVLFTSDNGSQQKGSNAPLRGRKGQTWEGGQRVPCVARWPGKISEASESSEIVSTLDLLPTFAKLAGVPLPEKTIDGHDASDILLGEKDAKSKHEAFYYYQMDQLQCVRSGKWKLHLALESKKRNWGKPEGKKPQQLFDLEKDVGESTDVSSDQPEVVKRLLALAEKGRSELGDVGRPGKGQRKAGFVKKASPRLIQAPN